MKAIKKGLKPIAFLLTALMLFESCVVYHKTPINLAQASEEHIKTKVVKTNGEVVKYKYIIYEDNQFYGMNRRSGEWIKTPLNQEDLSKVQTKDNTGSTLLTIAVLLPIGLFLFVIVYCSAGGDCVGLGDPS